MGGDEILLDVLSTGIFFFFINSPASAKPQISQANGDSADCNAQIVVIAANLLPYPSFRLQLSYENVHPEAKNMGLDPPQGISPIKGIQLFAVPAWYNDCPSDCSKSPFMTLWNLKPLPMWLFITKEKTPKNLNEPTATVHKHSMME